MLAALAGAMAARPALAVPPYSGTIFIDPDIITEADPTTFVKLTDAGRAVRTMFDRRVDNFITVNAYLFDASYSDGLRIEVQVNPEFGSVEAARTEAATYAPVIGRLPNYLRADVETASIHEGVQPFGGGNNNLLIHVGQADAYVADGILEETLFHEASHTSMDSRHANAAGWLAAQTADGEFISTYARDNPTREDVAESLLPWFALRYRADRISQTDADKFAATIPHRIAYFDGLELDRFTVSPRATRPTLKLARVRPVAGRAKVVRIRGTASANTARLAVSGGKVKGLQAFTATVKFPLTKKRLTVRVVATSADGLSATATVVARRR